jgi:hypothetical protein
MPLASITGISRKADPIVMRLIAAAALALSTTLAVGQVAAPGDRVYVLHTEAQGTCSSLNWHLVATPTDVLSGMIAWDKVASVAGTIDPLVSVERFGKSGRQPADEDIPYDRHRGWR